MTSYLDFALDFDSLSISVENVFGARVDKFYDGDKEIKWDLLLEARKVYDMTVN